MNLSLLEVFENLERASQTHYSADYIPFGGKVYEFKELRNSIEKLSGPPEFRDHPQCDETLVNRFLEEPFSDYSAKEVRSLCFSHKAFQSRHFPHFISAKKNFLNSASIRGLLYNYHNYWKTCDYSALEPLLQSLIKGRAAKSASMRFWSENHIHLIGRAAPTSLGTMLNSSSTTPDKLSVRFGIRSGTDFFQETVWSAAVAALNSGSKRKNSYLMEFFYPNILEPKLVAHLLSSSIRTAHEQNDAELRSSLIKFGLTDKRFGDPRIWRNTSWRDVDDGQIKRFIQWLSKADIELFFNLIVSEKNDPHGRKPFWLAYSSKVAQSRAVISPEDLRKHSTKLATLKEDGHHFGEARGQTSAFILDFGRIVAVEFSESGNALYFYDSSQFKTIVENIWGNLDRVTALKDKSKVIRDGVVRHAIGWQQVSRRLLAQYGVYPESF